MAAGSALLIDTLVVAMIVGAAIGLAVAVSAVNDVFGIFYVPLLLGYLWPLWDKQNQTFHDKVANSIVVHI